MLVNPAATYGIGHRLTRDAAERLARNWSMVLFSGALLIVSGVLILSIDWTVRSLATFVGALFIFHGLIEAATLGVGDRARAAGVLTGILSALAGVAIVVWPAPGLVVLAIFLGAWLIVIGTISMSGAFAARHVLPSWWLLLVTGVLEVALGVLALADPGATLAALITVGGIWAVAAGVSRVVLSFELKRLPQEAERAYASHMSDLAQRADNGGAHSARGTTRGAEA
jgi:uncharacterized membrane protein HdeD (DUF308 family)